MLSEPKCPPDHDRLPDSGFTMVELAVVLAILSLVSVMAMSILMATQNAAKAIGWQAEANTELRRLLDDTFADLETARPPSLCLNDGASTYSKVVNTSATSTSKCPKVVDGVDPLATELLSTDRDFAGSVLTSAGQHHVCYFTHRVDPAFLGRSATGGSADNLGNSYQEVCLLVLSNNLYLIKWPENSTDINTRPTGAVPRLIGAIDGPSVNFAYFARSDDATDQTVTDAATFNVLPSSVGYDSMSLNPTSYGLTGAAFTEQILRPADRARAGKVRLKLVVVTGKTTHKRTRSVEYQVALRGAAYQSERCWNGKKVAVTVPGDSGHVVLTCASPT